MQRHRKSPAFVQCGEHKLLEKQTPQPFPLAAQPEAGDLLLGLRSRTTLHHQGGQRLQIQIVAYTAADLLTRMSDSYILLRMTPEPNERITQGW